MRVDVNDRNATSAAIVANATVTLNGERQRFVIAADDELGWVEVIARENGGSALRDAVSYKRERLTGVVEIEVPKNLRSDGLFPGCWVKTECEEVMGPLSGPETFGDGSYSCGRSFWDQCGNGLDDYDEDTSPASVVEVYPSLAAASAANPGL